VSALEVKAAGFARGTAAATTADSTFVQRKDGDALSEGVSTAIAISNQNILVEGAGYSAGFATAIAIGAGGLEGVDKSGIVPRMGRRRRQEDIIQEEDEEILALLAEALPRIVAEQLANRTRR